MIILVRACAIALCLSLALPVAAQNQRIYKGQEAAALRCANTLALTAVALSRAELMDRAEKEVMLSI